MDIDTVLTNALRDLVGLPPTSRPLMLLRQQQAKYCIVTDSSTRIYSGQHGAQVQVITSCKTRGANKLADRHFRIPCDCDAIYLRTIADFPVQLNSVYVYPIQEYDALKTWMNKVRFRPCPC